MRRWYAPPRRLRAPHQLCGSRTRDLRESTNIAQQLKRSHAPTPVTISGVDPAGVCFDQSKNLWVTDNGTEILEFTAKSLKKLPATPTQAVTISSSSFEDIVGCAFDRNGNLWTADLDKDSLDEISTTQLQAGGSITPAIIITDTTEMSSAAPGFVTFDPSGNLWTDGRDDEELFNSLLLSLPRAATRPPRWFWEAVEVWTIPARSDSTAKATCG